jgi:hypothetical protein
MSHDYHEPEYNNIIKHEKFDETNAKYLLNDERFSKEDRTHLSQYFKHRISGSQLNCSYKFGYGCEEHKLGRLFPTDRIGLQSFRFDIRNPLAKKYYWDIDIVNCHYVIAEYFCEIYNIKHDTITYYINNRDECLKIVSNDRKKAKTEFLKVLYGGDIKLYNDSFNELNGIVNNESFDFLKNIEKEISILVEIIWAKYDIFHSLKTGKEHIPIYKKRNPKYSLMSLIFQTEERKLLMILDSFFTKSGRYMAVFIHDGGYIERLEQEHIFPNEILINAIQTVKNIYGINIKLSIKNIDYEWTPYKPQQSQYDIMKLEFELNNFLIGSFLYCIHSDGYTQSIKIQDAKIKFGNKIVEIWDNDTQKIKRKKFLDIWLEDPTRLQYERADFYPNIDKCPSSIYNLFKGFNGDKYKPNTDILWDDIIINVEPIIIHLDFITGGYSDRLNKTLANIIQNPDMKTGVATLIRDMGGLFIEGGGVGKNLFFEWFGNNILGEKYFIVVGDNREIYNSFNSIFEGKLLTLVEEASSKENHINNDILKSKITSNKQNINKKCIAQYEVSDYNRFIFCSNNRNAFPLRQGSRRLEVFDSNPIKRGNIQYFNTLAKHLANPIVIWSYYKYLQSITTYKTPIEFQSTVPITQAYRDLRLMNAPLYHKWLVSCIQNDNLNNGSTTDLYKQFTEWIQDNKECSPDRLISQTAFGRLLLSATEVRLDINGECCIDYNLDNQGLKYKQMDI